MNHPEATQAALSILRSGQNFQWYVIPLLAGVVYIYANEISNQNWRAISAGLALYSVHWFYEILNAKTPTFIWVYPWWGALSVFLFVYIPFFLAAFYVCDWKPAVQRAFIGSLFSVDLLMLVTFAGILKWI